MADLIAAAAEAKFTPIEIGSQDFSTDTYNGIHLYELEDGDGFVLDGHHAPSRVVDAIVEFFRATEGSADSLLAYISRADLEAAIRQRWAHRFRSDGDGMRFDWWLRGEPQASDARPVTEVMI